MRLIDADDLKKTWYKEHNIEPGETGAMFVGNNEVPKFIDRARTIDAVPVVRCKECRHWCEMQNLTGACLRLCAIDGALWLGTDATDFCSFAERRDDE